MDPGYHLHRIAWFGVWVSKDCVSVYLFIGACPLALSVCRCVGMLVALLCIGFSFPAFGELLFTV
jgi:hypothetical protein